MFTFTKRFHVPVVNFVTGSYNNSREIAQRSTMSIFPMGKLGSFVLVRLLGNMGLSDFSSVRKQLFLGTISPIQGLFPKTKFYSKVFPSLCLPALTRSMSVGWGREHERGGITLWGPANSPGVAVDSKSTTSFRLMAELGLLPAWITIIVWGHLGSVTVTSEWILFSFHSLSSTGNFPSPEHQNACSPWHNFSQLLWYNCAFYSFL